VGTKCSVQKPSSGSGWETFTRIFPEDVNRAQTFDIEAEETVKLKLVFEESSDFFGRIIIYDLHVDGNIVG